MSAGANGERRYGVHLSGVIAKRLRQLQRRATLEGRGKAAVTAFRQIIERLEHDPFDFGEALYRLPALRMQVRHGGIGPMFIDFAVCEDRPLVFIKGVTLMPQRP